MMLLELKRPVGPKLYHGTRKNLPLGTVLRAQPDGYTSWEENRQIETLLEKARPQKSLSRLKSVYAVADIEEIDPAGGYLNYVYEIAPIGRVEKNDMAWYSELFTYLSGLESDPSYREGQEINRLAQGYWSGQQVPDSRGSLFEYRCLTARIKALVEEN